MGNGQGKEAQPGSSRGHARSLSRQQPTSPTTPGPDENARHGRSHSTIYTTRSGRGSRHDISFLGIGGSSDRDPALEPRRETKAEREARKLEKERQLRVLERERSLREEGVDGGYLVTLGTYTGPEDFSKPTVRQLQIERRLAPFWKGLDDHEDTWTEHQIISVVNGKPLPAPDDIPDEEPPRPSNLSSSWNPRSSNANVSNLTVPIGGRSMSQQSDRSSHLSPAHPAFSLPSPTSPIATTTSSSPFFRGRAKTLAALTVGSRNASQTDMTPQEVQLPQDPYVNGQRIEVFLYKSPSECPICFMFYPPYLNKTRCCDQLICSECFVQIKRPDPHPPEHHDELGQPLAEPQEDGPLSSEPACCPFCKQPELGITYEPPPFRRGLVHANAGSQSLASAASAMSSTSSLNSQGLTSPGRRRATSLAATDASVITTDRVRPDWAKKLADARALALRRAAAATALHNAAYMMGNLQSERSGFTLGRRRRTMFGNDTASSSGVATPRRDGEISGFLASAITANRDDDLTSNRSSSRRENRLEDLEELMMMEAIRLSLAAEEERKKKEDKEAAKESKKEEKKKVKEAKKAGKAARKSGFFPVSCQEGSDEQEAESSAAGSKGKAVDRSAGSDDLDPRSSTSRDESQRHLQQSRANIQQEVSSTGSSGLLDPLDLGTSHRAALRQLSNASSSVSSLADSIPGSLDAAQDDVDSSASFGHNPNLSGLSLADESVPQGTPGTEPMFNFRSLAEVITHEKRDRSDAQHIENVDRGRANPHDGLAGSPDTGSTQKATPGSNANEVDVSPSGAPRLSEIEPMSPLENSVATLKPSAVSQGQDDEIGAAPQIEVIPSHTHEHHLDHKQIGDVSMVDAMRQPHQTTQ